MVSFMTPLPVTALSLLQGQHSIEDDEEAKEDGEADQALTSRAYLEWLRQSGERDRQDEMERRAREDAQRREEWAREDALRREEWAREDCRRREDWAREDQQRAEEWARWREMRNREDALDRESQARQDRLWSEERAEWARNDQRRAEQWEKLLSWVREQLAAPQRQLLSTREVA